MIFCIGLSKTGTRSLAHGLRRLGYHAVHGSYEVDRHITANLTESRSMLAGLPYDAYADIPAVCTLFHRLDRRYPSRFIYTERDTGSWIASRRRHLESHPKSRTWDWFDRTPDEWIREKQSHEQRLEAHFSGKGNLLRMNILEGDGYPKLCDFLGVSCPDEPFPHVK